MTHDPTQTLRWSVRPDPIYAEWCIITVRGHDSRSVDYDYNQIVEPEDHPFFWSIIREMQHRVLRKIT